MREKPIKDRSRLIREEKEEDGKLIIRYYREKDNKAKKYINEAIDFLKKRNFNLNDSTLICDKKEEKYVILITLNNGDVYEYNPINKELKEIK